MRGLVGGMRGLGKGKTCEGVRKRERQGSRITDCAKPLSGIRASWTRQTGLGLGLWGTGGRGISMDGSGRWWAGGDGGS